jgi:hypothetical protein
MIKQRPNASLFHQHFGEILTNSPIFKNYSLFQEYRLDKVNPSFTGRPLFIDWVISDLKVCAELMGTQHEKVSDFSGKSEDGGIQAFKDGRKRDKIKKQYILDAGWTYIEIPYKDRNKITDQYILDKIKEATIENEPNGEIIYSDKCEKSTPIDNKQSIKHQEELKHAREYKHQQYLRWKERKSCL